MPQNHEHQEFKHKHTCANPVCQKLFGSNRKHSLTCSPKCKMAVSRAKKQTQDTKRLYRFETSPFAHFLAVQCLRAESVQVVPRDLDLLAELHQIVKLASKADGYGSTKDYSICHLHPVRSLHRVGTLHPSNLVVSDRAINAKHSNALPAKGIGHSILKATLSPQWRVSEDTPKKLVIQKLVQYLGEAFSAKLAVNQKLQPATRTKYLDQLAPHLEHPSIKAAGDLSKVTTPNLSKLVALVTGKASGSFQADTWGMNPGEVFMAECKRLSKYYPHLEAAHDEYLEVHEEFLGDYLDAQHKPSDYKPYMYNKAKELLPQFIVDADGAKARVSVLVQKMFDVFHKQTTLKPAEHALDIELLPFQGEDFTTEVDHSLCLVAPALEVKPRSTVSSLSSFLADSIRMSRQNKQPSRYTEQAPSPSYDELYSSLKYA